MKAFKIFCFSFIMLLSAFTAAHAIPIVGNLAVDFRSPSWSGADTQSIWTVGDATATALPTGSKLYQDSVDGLGVRAGTQDDEIDLAEKIRVTFAGGMNLRGVWLTDLFGTGDGPGGAGEQGQVIINGGAFTFNFSGTASDQVNGEQYIDFGQTIVVTSAEFGIFGGNTNNDFSVAGFVGVPEPITMLLLGFGLVGLAGVRRFKK